MCCTYQSDNTFVPLQFTLLPKTKMLKSQKNIQPISIFFCTSQQDNLSPHGKKKKLPSIQYVQIQLAFFRLVTEGKSHAVYSHLPYTNNRQGHIWDHFTESALTWRALIQNSVKRFFSTQLSHIASLKFTLTKIASTVITLNRRTT